MAKAATVDGDILAVEGANTEEIARLIMTPAKSCGRADASEARHTSYPSIDPAMTLFQLIVDIRIGPVPDCLAELGADRVRRRIVAIAGDPIGNRPGCGFRRPKECLGRREVASLSQHRIN